MLLSLPDHKVFHPEGILITSNYEAVVGSGRSRFQPQGLLLGTTSRISKL